MSFPALTGNGICMSAIIFNKPDSTDNLKNYDQLNLAFKIDSCFNAEPPHIDEGISLSGDYLSRYELLGNISDTNIAQIHNIRANMFHMAYEFDSAGIHYRKAIDIFENYNIQNPDIAYFLYRPFGMLLHKTGSLQQAIDIFNQAAIILIESESPELAGIYCETGNVYLSMGNNELAIKYYELGIEVDGKPKWLESILAENIGLCLISLGDTINAMAQLNRSLEIAVEIADEFGIISVLSALGELKYSTGDLKGAIAVTRKAISTGSSIDGIDKRELAKMHFRLGQYYYESDSFDLALEQFDIMLDILSVDVNIDNFRNKRNYDPWIMMALKFTGNCYDGKYKSGGDTIFLQRAHSNYEKAGWIADVLRNSYNTNVSKLFLSEQTHDLYKSAVGNCYELYELTNNTVYLFEALNYSEQNKYQLLFEQMTGNPSVDTLQILHGIQDSIINLNIRLASIERDINMLKQRGRDLPADTLELLKSDYRKTRKIKSEILKQIEDKNPVVSSRLVKDDVLNLLEIDDHFIANPGELWIELLTTDTVVFVFYLDANGIKLSKYPVSSVLSKLEFAIHNIRKQPEFSSDNEPNKRLIRSLNDIYNVILKDHLENSGLKFNHIVIVPDHIWTYLPFESLVTSYNVATNWYVPELFLINDYSISYSGSLALLNYKDNRTKKFDGKKYAGFAPEFDMRIEINASLNELRPLEYNTNEVAVAGKILGGSIHIGPDADLANFKKEIFDNETIHLATHSYFDSLVPMNSKLFFSDTSLYLYEICQMHIPAELIILNACNTGIGRHYQGEGPMSISNGFLQSGSGACIMNLWSVNDFSSATLTKYFVEQLGTGYPASISLQNAKKKYLAESRKLFHHPYYWASNVLSGRTGQNIIKKDNVNRIIFVVAGIIVILIIILLFRKPSQS